MDLVEAGINQINQASHIEHGSPSQREPLMFAALPVAQLDESKNCDGFARFVVAELLHNAGGFGVLGSRQAAREAIISLVERTGTGIAVIDLMIDRVGADSDARHDRADLFMVPDRSEALDPRALPTPHLARASLHGGPGSAERIGAWWGELIASWAQLGLGGVRLRGLGGLPQGAVLALLRALRAHASSALLIADTAGVSWDEIRSLAGIGLDGVSSSLPWWNWQDDWFADELAMQRQVAPVIADLSTGRLAGADLRRALAFCAAEGIGWIAAPDDASRNALGLAEALKGMVPARRLTAPDAPSAAYLALQGTDPRWSAFARILLFNMLTDRAVVIDPADFVTATGGNFKAFIAQDADPSGGNTAAPGMLVPGTPVPLAVGEARLYEAAAIAHAPVGEIEQRSAMLAAEWPRLAIENPSPAVDGGRFVVRRTAGEVVHVEADIIGDGHDLLAVGLQWRTPDEQGDDRHGWQETRMRLLGNDRWTASFPLITRGMHEYRIEAWRDHFATYRHELGAKAEAGVSISLELIEGRTLLEGAIKRHARGHAEIAALLAHIESKTGEEAAQCRLLLCAELASLMEVADDRPHNTHSATIPVEAERSAAGYASWYEVFPRSMSDDVHRHGTFRDVERHLPRIRAMGFDVLYFPPVHPIGRINRKGPNNTLTPGPGDVGSPYAVGGEEGGHDAIHPDLGTLEDFLHLRNAAEAHGLEIAIDFAIQCAPDHPWLREHKEWFAWRPDGTVRYAENPPKKYQDIVNVDFYNQGAVPGLWLALANIVMFWAKQGIRLFRVDNPHTKPLPFWQWMIAEVRARYPDAVFLAEAFTRPKVMNRLAKIGFGQSYTYFTWRNSKAELTEYLTQLSREAPRDYFRPHFFVNTPDINPFFLQTSGRPGFLIRAALAATMSGLWGVYNGFELCEGAALPGREEYLDSEKYQRRTWDWERPGNIVADITRLNRIRAENPALHSHLPINFLPASNDTVLFYEKTTEDRGNCIFCLINLDPHNVQQSTIELPLYRWGLPPEAVLQMHDLIGGGRFTLAGSIHTVTLTPQQPYFIWRASPFS